jgi:hypothetical protein
MRFSRYFRRGALPEQPVRPLLESPTVTLTEAEARACQLALSHLMGRAVEEKSDEPFIREAAAVLIRLSGILDRDEPYFKDFRAAMVAAVDQADAALASRSGVSKHS